MRVPRTEIARVDPEKPKSGKESVNLTFLGTPTRWVTFSHAMLAHGPYGLRRHVRALGIQPDAPEEFDRILDATRP